MKQVIAHIRKSTHGRDENGIERQEGSFERQQLEITDYAKCNQMEIARWYEEAVTGKSIRKRKVFLQMVRDVLRPGCPYKDILFGAYDRFMRDVHEAWRYELELRDAGIKLHFSNLKNDGSEAEEMYKDMYRRSAASFSRDLAVKVIGGMLRKARKGCWLGGIPPYGYRKVKDSNGDTWLVIYDEEAKVVRIIFEKSLMGMGHKKIALWLNQQGISASETAKKRNSIMNKNPDGRWSGNAVRMLLRNPTYRGICRWNKRSRIDCYQWDIRGYGTIEVGKLRTESPEFWKNGDQNVKRSHREYYVDRVKPEEKWIVIEGKVPAIISPEVFDAVQQRFTTYSSKRWRRMNHAKHLMGGALLCKVCGNRFYGHRYRKKIKTTGEDAYYEFYRCYGDTKKGSHSSGTVSILIKLAALDSVVADGILRRIQYLVNPSRVMELFKQKLRNFLDDKPDRLAAIEREIKQVSGEIERMIYAYRKFEQPIPEDKVKELKDRQKILESQKDGLVASGYANIVRNIDYEAERFLENLKRSGSAIELSDPKERIRIREAFLEKAEFWYNDRPEVKLFWRKIAKFSDQPITSTST